MARTRMPSNLLGLVDSDSEDDLGGVAKGRTATEAATKPGAPPMRDSMAAPKRGRPPAAATAAKIKVSKPAQQSTAARRAADKRSAAAAAAAVAAAEATAATEAEAATSSGRGRRALADKTNEQQASEPAEAGAIKKRGRGRPKAVPKVVEIDIQLDEEDDDDEAWSEIARPTATARQPGRPRAAPPPAEEGEEDMDGAEEENSSGGGHGEDGADCDANGPESLQARPSDRMEIDTDDRSGTRAVAPQKSSSNNSNSYSGLRSPFRPSQRHLSRPSSSLSSDGASSDVAVRRRLGDLTKKYDALEARYRDLKEIGIKEAERNFDRLKKKSDERNKIAHALIDSLKADLAAHREFVKEGDRARRELEASERHAADLQAQVDRLTAALGDSQAEAKTLSTKLAAARSTTTDAAAGLPLGVVPSSAMKNKKMALTAGGHGGHGGLPASVVEAMQASSQTAQLKEDLYGDLTGLLVRSAKRETTTEPGGGTRVREMYDCIQTGRNGSLHFKLCLDTGGSGAAADAAADKAAGATTTTGGDEARFVYTPQIDPSRDAALIERLPDYLVEEISFPRMQAAKFYKRVMQRLTEELY